MKDFIKNIGSILGVLAFIGASILIIVLLIKGGVWISANIYQWLITIAEITFTIDLLILLPLAFFKKTRRFAASGLMISSFAFGITTWVWSFLITYSAYGTIGLIIGLFLFGIGVLPIAMFATAINGVWSVFGELIMLAFITFGTRIFALYLEEKS